MSTWLEACPCLSAETDQNLVSIMTTRSVLRGSFWTIVGVLIIAHLGAGWYFTGELIEDGFLPDPDPIEATASGVGVSEVSFAAPLGELDAWHIPAQGSTWVIHVHGKGGTPDDARHLFEPIRQAGYPQLSITYRNDDGQPMDPSGYYQYGASEWEDVADAVDFARLNGADDVVLSGFSTGASHILAFVYRNNSAVVRGLMFDSPNIDFAETVDFNAAQREMPIVPMKIPPTLTPVAKFFTSLRIGVNWKSIDYEDKPERCEPDGDLAVLRQVGGDRRRHRRGWCLRRQQRSGRRVRAQNDRRRRHVRRAGQADGLRRRE